MSPPSGVGDLLFLEPFGLPRPLFDGVAIGVDSSASIVSCTPFAASSSSSSKMAAARAFSPSQSSSSAVSARRRALFLLADWSAFFVLEGVAAGDLPTFFGVEKEVVPLALGVGLALRARVCLRLDVRSDLSLDAAVLLFTGVVEVAVPSG